MTRVRIACLLSTILLLGASAACTSDKEPGQPVASDAPGPGQIGTPGATDTPPPLGSAPPAGGIDASTNGVKVATTGLGTIVVDGEGNTLYLYTKDKKDSGTSTCVGQCAIAWPPVTAANDNPAAIGVTATLTTITRQDGGKQLTLNGWPLYRYAKDAKPGETTGQKVGGVWFALKPDGTAIK